MIPRSRSYSLTLLLCIASLASLAAAQTPTAQTLTIRMVDGSSGKPFGDKNVYISFWRADPSRRLGVVIVPLNNGNPGIDIPLDKNGIGHVDIPPQAETVKVERVENVVKYGKRGQYNICRVIGNQYTPNPGLGQLVPLTEVAAHGYVPETQCTPQLPPHPAPGEFIFMAVTEHCAPLCGLSY
jgi:hypothetical protein